MALPASYINGVRWWEATGRIGRHGRGWSERDGFESPCLRWAMGTAQV